MKRKGPEINRADLGPYNYFDYLKNQGSYYNKTNSLAQRGLDRSATINVFDRFEEPDTRPVDTGGAYFEGGTYWDGKTPDYVPPRGGNARSRHSGPVTGTVAPIEKKELVKRYAKAYGKKN